MRATSLRTVFALSLLAAVPTSAFAKDPHECAERGSGTEVDMIIPTTTLSAITGHRTALQ